uniref:C2H2-type domain-containing protein n=1 Tax=Beihai hermit crab virus 2 TaxID=1922389 RepID=A0A1L3KPD9_9VIRU|nr:hypothetical protein [Beihai hermit crab virus 2]
MKCKHCYYDGNRDELKSHLKDHGVDVEAEVKKKYCKSCDRVFKKRGATLTHIMLHHTDLNHNVYDPKEFPNYSSVTGKIHVNNLDGDQLVITMMQGNQITIKGFDYCLRLSKDEVKTMIDEYKRSRYSPNKWARLHYGIINPAAYMEKCDDICKSEDFLDWKYRVTNCDVHPSTEVDIRLRDEFRSKFSKVVKAKCTGVSDILMHARHMFEF